MAVKGVLQYSEIKIQRVIKTWNILNIAWNELKGKTKCV